jgi:hypothetical protein
MFAQFFSTGCLVVATESFQQIPLYLLKTKVPASENQPKPKPRDNSDTQHNSK